MSVAIVTGFYPIPGHPRSAQEYDALGERLCNETETHVICYRTGDIRRCWLYTYLQRHPIEPLISVADNPVKNSLAYHIVQAEKSMWLASAALELDVDVLVWVDYGIFHVPGVTAGIIDDFVKRAETERAIAVPGCRARDDGHDDEHPNWRFCGGVMVVPAQWAFAFNIAMQAEYSRLLVKSNRLTWEVNVLAHVEKRDYGLPIWWYRAGHDATMFTDYSAAGRA